MSLPGSRHGSWNNGPDGHVRLILVMTVHRIHLGLYQKQQKLELPEVRRSAGRYLGRRYGLSGQAVRAIHHSTKHLLPPPSPLSSSYAGRTPCWVSSLRPSASVVSAFSISGSCHTLIYVHVCWDLAASWQAFAREKGRGAIWERSIQVE